MENSDSLPIEAILGALGPESPQFDSLLFAFGEFKVIVKWVYKQGHSLVWLDGD